VQVLKAGQLLLKTTGMYMSLGKANLTPLVERFKKHKGDAEIVSALLDVVLLIANCQAPPKQGGCCGGVLDPEVFKTKYAALARESFFNAGGMTETINVVTSIKATDTAKIEVVTKALETIATCLLVSYNPYVCAGSTRKLVEAMKPHHGLVLDFLTLSGEQYVALRGAAARVMQGLILHSNTVDAKAIQDLILTQGYLLHILFGSISHMTPPNVLLTNEMERIVKEHAATNGHKAAAPTITAFRGLLSLTYDSNTHVETTLARAIPRGLVAHANKYRTDVLRLALESPFNRAKVPEVQNLVWVQYRENVRKASNWEAVCAKFDEQIAEPTLLWTPVTRMELILAVGNEIADLTRQREANAKSTWDYEGFEVEYPSLGVHLKVGEYYAHILLPLIEGANQYSIDEKDLGPLVAAAFQRAVIEDDNGWKLACIRIMSSLYKHYAKILKDADAVPYLVWLLNAENKTVNPLWRDHILAFLDSLFQSPLNITKFVKAGGIKVLEYYLNLAHLATPQAARAQVKATDSPNKSAPATSSPVSAAASEPAKPQETADTAAEPAPAPATNITASTKSPQSFGHRHTLDDSDEEENDSSSRNPSPTPSAVNASQVAIIPASPVSSSAQQDGDEKSAEEVLEMVEKAAERAANDDNDDATPLNMDTHRAPSFGDPSRRLSRQPRRVQPSYINYLEREALLDGIAPPLTYAEVAARVLKLLEDIVNNAPRLRRTVFKDTLQDTLTNLILCPIPELADRALGLLNTLLEANAHVLGRLHEKGTFLFVLYASRTKFTSNATIFLDRYHKKPYIAREAKTTVLAPYLPACLASYADRMGGAKLVELLEREIESPAIIWGPHLRAVLNAGVEEQVKPFIAELRHNPQLAQYEYTAPVPIRYPQLDDELCVANIFVRVFNANPNEPIDEPEFFLSELIRVFNEEKHKPDNITQLMRAQINMTQKLPDSSSLRPYAAMGTLLRLLEACPRPYDFQNAHLRIGVRLLRLVLMVPNSGNAQKCVEHGGAVLLAKMLKEIGAACMGRFEAETLDDTSADNLDLLNQVLNALTEVLAYSSTDTAATSSATPIEAVDAAADASADASAESPEKSPASGLHSIFSDLSLTRSIMRLVSALLKSNVAILRAQLVTSAVRFVSFLINHSAHAVEHILDAGIILDAVYLALFHDVQAAQLYADKSLRPSTPPEKPMPEEAKSPGKHERKASHIPDKVRPPEHELNVRHASASLLASLLKVPGAAEETQAQIRAVLTSLLSPGLINELKVSPVRFISLVDKEIRTPVIIWNAECRTEVRQYLDAVIDARNKSAGGTWIQARAPFTFRIKPVREEVMVLDIYLSVYNELETPYTLPEPLTEATFLEAIISYAASMCVKAASTIKNILPLPAELSELVDHSEALRRTLGTSADESHPRAIVCAVSIRKLINDHPSLLQPSLEAPFDRFQLSESQPSISPPHSPTASSGSGDVISTSSTSIVTTVPAGGRRSSSAMGTGSLGVLQSIPVDKIRSFNAFLALATVEDPRLQHEVLSVVYTLASNGKEGLKVLLHIANDIHAMLNAPRNYITDYPRLPLVLALLQLIIHSQTSEVNPKVLTSLLENGLVASLMLLVCKGEAQPRIGKNTTLSYKKFGDKGLNLDTIRSNKAEEVNMEAMRLAVGCITYDMPYRQAVVRMLLSLCRHVHVGSLFKETLLSLLTVPFAAHLGDENKFITMFDGSTEAPDFFWNAACRSDLTNFLVSEVVEIVKHQRSVQSQGVVYSLSNYPKYPLGYNYSERFDHPTLDAQLVVQAPYIYVYALNKYPYFKNLNEHEYYCGLLKLLESDFDELLRLIDVSVAAREYQGPNPPTKQELQDIDNLVADRRARVAALLLSLRNKTKDVPHEQDNVIPYIPLLVNILNEETINNPDAETQANQIIDHVIALFATLATQAQIAIPMAIAQVAKALVPHLYPVCVSRYSKKLLNSDESFTKRTIYVVDTLQDLVRRSSPVVDQLINLGVGAYIVNMLLTPTVYNQTLRQKAAELILLMGQDPRYGYDAMEHALYFLTLEFSDELCKTPELVLKMIEYPHESQLCKRSWNSNIKDKLSARLREILPDMTSAIQASKPDEEVKSLFTPEMISSVFPPYPPELNIAKIAENARHLANGTMSTDEITVGNLGSDQQQASPAPFEVDSSNAQSP